MYQISRNLDALDLAVNPNLYHLWGTYHLTWNRFSSNEEEVRKADEYVRQSLPKSYQPPREK